MAWVFVVGWAVRVRVPGGVKMAQQEKTRGARILTAAGLMIGSGFLFCLAHKTIPSGTSCVVWTGNGSAGIFMAGWRSPETPRVRAGILVWRRV